MHNHPVFPPSVPFAGVEGGNVRGRRLVLALEVIGPHVGLTPPKGSHCEKEVEQAHRRSYAIGCHSSSFLTRMMSRSDRKRRARRPDAIDVHSGLDLDHGGELKHEGRRQRVWAQESRIR
jgi:hypothetical protein